MPKRHDDCCNDSQAQYVLEPVQYYGANHDEEEGCQKRGSFLKMFIIVIISMALGYMACKHNVLNKIKAKLTGKKVQSNCMTSNKEMDSIAGDMDLDLDMTPSPASSGDI